jgi:hypothetical protein
MLDGSVPPCPWCSAALTPGVSTCPACGANLAADDAAEIPGVTEIDKTAVGVARPPAIPRGRWRAWITGENVGDALTPADVKAIAPPDQAVRAEIRRLERAALLARLQADTDDAMPRPADVADASGVPAAPTSSESADPAATTDRGQPAAEGDTAH